MMVKSEDIDPRACWKCRHYSRNYSYRGINDYYCGNPVIRYRAYFGTPGACMGYDTEAGTIDGDMVGSVAHE